MKKLFILLFIASTVFANAQVSICNLRCEQLQNPLGIDVVQPRFSWQLQSNLRNIQQVSYQILVSTSAQKLAANIGDVWNSNVINSSKTILIPYNGKPLQSATAYYWKVKVTSNKGECATNENAFFTTGFFKDNDLPAGQAGWKAKWIGLR